MSAPRQTASYLLKRFAGVGIRPQTQHGQNFLIDLNLVRILIDAAQLTPRDVVLEVGTVRDGEIYHLRYGTAIGNDCLDILEFYTLGSASFFEGFTAPDKPAADMPKTDDIITRLSRNRQIVKAR